MPAWGATIYGDPCRDCGFSWAISVDDAITIVRRLPGTFEHLTDQTSGSKRHPDLGWSVAEYVCHVADNLRIWAERLMGVVGGAGPEVGEYDENELADARNYERIPLQAALWSLDRSVYDWAGAVTVAEQEGVVLVHPERGPQSVSDVVRTNAHDAFHHGWDIQRTIADDSH